MDTTHNGALFTAPQTIRGQLNLPTDAPPIGAHEREVRAFAQRLRSMAARHAGRRDTVGPAMLDVADALDTIAGELHAAACAGERS